jgi:hypothetical protein
MRDAAEPFNVLRLVLGTQPRSNPIAFGSSVKLRPKPPFCRHLTCGQRTST